MSHQWSIIIDEDELEGVVSVAWDVLDSKRLDLLMCVDSNELVGPKIPNFDELLGRWLNTKILNSKLEVFVDSLPPVDNCSDGGSITKLGCIN